MVKYTIFIPIINHISIIKSQEYYLILTHNTNYLNYPLGKFIYYNKQVNCISSYCSKQLITNLVVFLKNYSSINLTILKFKGKGFKLTKKEFTIDFLFNFSHIKYFIPIFSNFKKLTKSKFAIITPYNNYLKNITILIKDIRTIDIYSMNGLRLKRQIIYKRKGKTLST